MLKRLGLLAICTAPLLAGVALQKDTLSAEDEYFASKPSDPVAKLMTNISTGKVKLTWDPRTGYLPSLLKELGIPASSQILVFSKTSLQTAYISPENPRAIYFNDHTYLGFINGAPYVELTSVDPKLGPVFYTFQNMKVARPAIARQTHNCTNCHSGSMTRGVPGVMARSVYAGYDGMPKLTNGTFLTTPKSPINERWGGWYVSGTHGKMRHMGNEPARGTDQDPKIDMEKGANVTDLSRYFEPDVVLTPHSDIVALMVAEQQMAIQNQITRVNFATKNALRDDVIYKPSELVDGKHSAGALSRIKNACEPLIQALLCSGEVALTSPIKGSTSFASDYAAAAPKDKKGRSLGQLNLQSRVLEYSCSPMIYSSAFDGLPVEAKTQIFKRLHEILDGKDTSKPFAHLTDQGRKAIAEILSETKPEFARSAN